MSVTRESVLEALGRVVTRGIRLTALADEGAFDKAKLKQVIAKYRMDSDKPNPTTV